MIYYFTIIPVLALIDMLRMKRVWGKRNNINHWGSYLAAAIGVAGLWLIFHGLHLSWLAIPFVVGCAAIRGISFDICLNMLVNFFIIPRSIDYISLKSNALNESRLNKIPFWWRRAGYIVLFGIVLLVNHFMKWPTL